MTRTGPVFRPMGFAHGFGTETGANVKDRVDLEAMEMAGAPDHGTVLQAIQDITASTPGAQAPGFAD